MRSEAPILLLTARGEGHVFDDYLAEVLLTEGYACFEHVRGAPLATESAQLAIIGSGAAAQLPLADVEAYLNAGGKLIVIKPPDSWAELLGLSIPGELYRTAPDAYMRVSTGHAWLHDWPDRDLQCPGQARVFRAETAEPLAFISGQFGMRSVFPAVVHHRVSSGEVVGFMYDLPETLVLFQQGRPENSSTGRNPDANGDGKFCADDAMEGMRDYRLRFVPQADLHRDLLVRVIRGLTADTVPLPRLWHLPDAAPAVLFVDGDGDGMTWEDMEATVAIADGFDTPYTLYMMREEIEAFDCDAIDQLMDPDREGGYFDFGVHPWCGPQPTVAEWETEIAEIVALFTDEFGFEPTALRSHSCIFPGWDETPKILQKHGLRLDTNVCPGYRYREGYPNGSGLPLRFVSRHGEVIDCWEQSTIQTEDGALTPKVLLPPHTREQAQALAEWMLERAATTYHSVFHPYFHPINLGERAAKVADWFRGVLRKAQELRLPGVTAAHWLHYNDGRIGARFEQVSWQADQRQLSFVVNTPLSFWGATILLPPCGQLRPVEARVEGEVVALQAVPLEHLDWTALLLDLEEGRETSVVITYGDR